jgi:hypothetical protein
MTTHGDASHAASHSLSPGHIFSRALPNNLLSYAAACQ